MCKSPIKIAAMVCAAVVLLGSPWSAEAGAQTATIGDLFPRPPEPFQTFSDCTALGPLGAPGNELFRVHNSDHPGEPFEAPVGTKLYPPEQPYDKPLHFELHVEQEIPEQIGDLVDDLRFLQDAEDERSVVQIELPMHQKGRDKTDEDRQVSVFNKPQYCEPDGSCPQELGLWRATLIRDDPQSSGCELWELQLGKTYPDELDPRSPTESFRIIGLWSDMVLQPGDRVRFAYWGQLPWRSTEHLVHEQGQELRPHVRYRKETEDCPLQNSTMHIADRRRAQADPECWVQLSDDKVEQMRFTPKRPVFLHVVSPLDASITPPDRDNITVTLVAKDRYGNPSDMTDFGPLDVFAYYLPGPIVAPIPFCTATAVSGVSSYRASCSGQIHREGLVHFRVNPLPVGVTEVYNYTMVSDAPTYERKVGDTHIHAGMQLDEGPAQFMRSSQGGDHKADSARIWATLEYLEKVSVYDFGAISHHSVLEEGWQVPSGGVADYTPFEPGGECDVDPPVQGGRALRSVEDWWGPAQRASEEYPAGPEFYSYPAFEWHGEIFPDENSDGVPDDFNDNNRPRLHRVVMYRDHRPAADWPMLPGSAYNRSPLCLVRYIRNHIDDRAITADDVVIIPHMMTPEPDNEDWWLTYQDTDKMLALNVNREDVEEFHRIGEIYSARSRDKGPDLLTEFEAAEYSWGNPKSFTYRYGWHEAEAVIGVIGSSDNHHRMPGLNDDHHSNSDSYDQNEPTGTAIVLAARPAGGGSFRDTIFDAMRDRRTYATSGVRAWLDFRLVLAGGEEVQMGEEVCLAADAATIEAELAVGMGIHAIEIWQAEPGASSESYTKLLDVAGTDQEWWMGAVAITNQGANHRGLYYFRAFLRPPATANDQDPEIREAVWSSPIWIDWEESCPPPP